MKPERTMLLYCRVGLFVFIFRPSFRLPSIFDVQIRYSLKSRVKYIKKFTSIFRCMTALQVGKINKDIHLLVRSVSNYDSVLRLLFLAAKCCHRVKSIPICSLARPLSKKMCKDLLGPFSWKKTDNIMCDCRVPYMTTHALHANIII